MRRRRNGMLLVVALVLVPLAGIGWGGSQHPAPPAGAATYAAVPDPAPAPDVAELYEGIGRDAARLYPADRLLTGAPGDLAGHDADVARMADAFAGFPARLAAANRAAGWQPRWGYDEAANIDVMPTGGADHDVRSRSGRVAIGLRGVLLAGLGAARAGDRAGAIAAAQALAGTARRLLEAPGDPLEVVDLAQVATGDLEALVAALPAGDRPALRPALGARPGAGALRTQLVRLREAAWAGCASEANEPSQYARGRYTPAGQARYRAAVDPHITAILAGAKAPATATAVWVQAQPACWNDAAAYPFLITTALFRFPLRLPHAFHGEDRAVATAFLAAMGEEHTSVYELAEAWRDVDRRLQALRS